MKKKRFFLEFLHFLNPFNYNKITFSQSELIAGTVILVLIMSIFYFFYFYSFDTNSRNYFSENGQINLYLDNVCNELNQNKTVILDLKLLHIFYSKSKELGCFFMRLTAKHIFVFYKNLVYFLSTFFMSFLLIASFYTWNLIVLIFLIVIANKISKTNIPFSLIIASNAFLKSIFLCISYFIALPFNIYLSIFFGTLQVLYFLIGYLKIATKLLD